MEEAVVVLGPVHVAGPFLRATNNLVVRKSVISRRLEEERSNE